MRVALVDAPSVTHPEGCWMDPRPHRHVIHLLELDEPPWHRDVVGIPRPTDSPPRLEGRTRRR